MDRRQISQEEAEKMLEEPDSDRVSVVERPEGTTSIPGGEKVEVKENDIISSLPNYTVA